VNFHQSYAFVLYELDKFMGFNHVENIWMIKPERNEIKRQSVIKLKKKIIIVSKDDSLLVSLIIF